ncbi:MAG: nickel pincer cofactor biosynthesis protein LarC [Bacteroidales bacterium]
MEILFYDCFAGISGDMNLAAMIDLGVPRDYLESELRKLGDLPFELRVSRQKKNSIEGTLVDVVLTPEERVLASKHHHEEHRSWNEIKRMIERSTLANETRDLSIRIFERIALAEAKVHGVSVENVHFHEVGAVDSIVDIVGAAVCFNYLKPEAVYASPPQLGGGFVDTAHGKLPVPAPATAEILRGIPVVTGGFSFETTTPTGAAILAELVDVFTQESHLTIHKTGYGLGHRQMEIPNLLRVYLATVPEKEGSTRWWMIECNIDDMNPEMYDYLIDRILALGADDVFLTPAIMKKSRPATTLSVLCSEHIADAVSSFILAETTSLGIRKFPVSKEMLQRTTEEISVPAGKVRIKHAVHNGKVLRSKPEFEDCRRLASEKNLPLSEIYRQINEVLYSR